MKDNFILTLMIALYFLAFTWFFDMVNNKRNQDKLIQQKDGEELSLLQSQLNPHFLFNAMNTSYSAAIAEDSPQTAQQVLQISDLMRFALEKSNKDFISMEETSVFFKDSYDWVRVKLSELKYVKSEGNLLFIHTKSGILSTRMTISEILSIFPNETFMRIHKSYVVNLSGIDKLEKYKVTIAGETIPLANAYRVILERRLLK